MRHWLAFTLLWAIVSTGCAVNALSDNAHKVGEKEGWLSAPQLLPTGTRWLTPRPINANLIGITSR